MCIPIHVDYDLIVIYPLLKVARELSKPARAWEACMSFMDVAHIDIAIESTFRLVSNLNPVASGGIVVIALTCLNLKGHRKDLELNRFKGAELLAVPLVLFTGVIVTSYLAAMTVQDFWLTM